MRPWVFGLAGLLLSVGAIVADTLLVHIPQVRNGWWTLIPLGLGTLMAVVAMKQDRAWYTIALCFFSGWPGGYYVYLKFQPAPAAEPKVGIGKSFPGAALFDQDGHVVQLENLWKSGPLVVVLNRGGWSFVDRGELRGLRNAYESIAKAGASVVSVTIEPAEERKKTADALGVPFPLLCDTDRYLLRTLGMEHEGGGPGGVSVAVPATFVVDKAGKVRWMHRAATIRERPAPAEILEALQALR